MKADKADHHRSCQLAAQLSSLQQKKMLYLEEPDLQDEVRVSVLGVSCGQGPV